MVLSLGRVLVCGIEWREGLVFIGEKIRVRLVVVFFRSCFFRKVCWGWGFVGF